jgi:pullulanase/glycogen debranching enzyme
MTPETLITAEELRDEILQKFDVLYHTVFNVPEMSDETIELLALLPVQELKQIASWAEDYAACVWGYAEIARMALEVKD